MGGLYCSHCGETLPQTGLRCPTCTADVGWWLITNEKAQGPLELRELQEAWSTGALEGVDWVCVGEEGLRQRPETVVQLLRGSDYPKWRLIEDWTDFRNLFRLLLAVLLPLLALTAILLYWLHYWPKR